MVYSFVLINPFLWLNTIMKNIIIQNPICRIEVIPYFYQDDNGKPKFSHFIYKPLDGWRVSPSGNVYYKTIKSC